MMVGFLSGILYRRILGQIIRLGFPASAQNSIISFANIIVQPHINSFGEMVMAGYGAYTKIEGFGFLPITSFMMALTTFVGQNLGAKKYERTSKGARFILKGAWFTIYCNQKFTLNCWRKQTFYLLRYKMIRSSASAYGSYPCLSRNRVSAS